MLAMDKQWPKYRKLFHPMSVVLQHERKYPHLTRLCIDPSVPNIKSVSFNDLLLSGRNLHSDLLHLFTRLRRFKHFASNDIKKFYNCCFLTVRSSALTAFLWRPLGSQEPLQACYSRVLNYGIKNANLIAGLCLMRGLRRFSDDETLFNYRSFHPYVDDVFCLEAKDVSLLYKRMMTVQRCLSSSNFPLKRWQLPSGSIQVNNPVFRDMIEFGILLEPEAMQLYDVFRETGKLLNPAEFIESQAVLLPPLSPAARKHIQVRDRSCFSKRIIESNTIPTHNILGKDSRLHDDTVSSRISFNLTPALRGLKQGPEINFENVDTYLQEHGLTRAGALSLVMSFWCCIGLLEIPKLNLKQAYKYLSLTYKGLKYKEKVPQVMWPLYQALIIDALHLKSLPVKRYMEPTPADKYESKPILICCYDASERWATGLVFYLSWPALDGSHCHNSIVLAKSYIHSTQDLGPAAEKEANALCAAVAAYEQLSRVHNMNVSETIFAGDSLTSMLSLRRPLTSHSRKIAYRWVKVLKSVELHQLFWLPSQLQPADLLTKPGADWTATRSRFFQEGGHLALSRRQWLLMSLTDSNGVTLTDEDSNSIFDADIDFDLGESVGVEFGVIV